MLLKFFSCLVLAAAAVGARAGEGMVQLGLARGAAKLPVHVMPNPDAMANLVLLPGGDAGTGKMVDGKPGNIPQPEGLSNITSNGSYPPIKSGGGL